MNKRGWTLEGGARPQDLSATSAGLAERPELSFVIPVYGSPQSLPELHRRIAAMCDQLGVSREIVFVDDRCPRGSWAVMQDLAAADPTVVATRLSRNFGQHPAIQAGLRLSRGAWVVVMDCDLQDRPEEVPALYARAREGFEVVRALRLRRRDHVGRRLLSWAFYGLLSWLTGVRHRAEVANFGVYSRKVVDAVISWNEIDLYFPAAIEWLGFARSDMPIEHGARHEGQSSYNIGKLMRLGMSIIIAFSDKPLRIAVVAGFFVSLASFLIGVVTLVLALMHTFSVPGWASIAFSIWFLSGVMISVLGLVGLYVGQVLRETKGRPNFVIDEIVRRELTKSP